MTRYTDARIEDILREMDPAPPALTEDERERAAAARDLILGTSSVGVRVEPRRRTGRSLLVAAVLVAVVAVAVPTAIGGGTAFASWAATPQPLPQPAAESAAATCRSALEVDDPRVRAVIGEKRGGWTYVLIKGPAAEGACLMPDDFMSTPRSADRAGGFFGSYDVDPPDAPTPARDALIETESMLGAVSVPGRFPFSSTKGWFTWVNGHVGGDVTGVTVDPPVGPDVEATVSRGRFTAWWPADEARGDRSGVSGAWTYTVTLADGTTRKVAL